jgi:hypothetical protein
MGTLAQMTCPPKNWFSSHVSLGTRKEEETVRKIPIPEQIINKLMKAMPAIAQFVRRLNKKIVLQ